MFTYRIEGKEFRFERPQSPADLAEVESWLRQRRVRSFTFLSPEQRPRGLRRDHKSKLWWQAEARQGLIDEFGGVLEAELALAAEAKAKEARRERRLERFVARLNRLGV